MNTLITVISIRLAIFTFWAEEGFVILAKTVEEAFLRLLGRLVHTHKTLSVCVCARVRMCVRLCTYVCVSVSVCTAVR